MAIIDNFEVTILVDGDPAAEFDDEEQPSVQSHDSKSITKYVEVRSGARFAFKYKVLPSYKSDTEDGLSLCAAIDGHCISSLLCCKESVDSRTGFTVMVDSGIVGNGADMRKLTFSFADLETRDTCEGDLATLQEKYGSLGCLDVYIHRVRVHGPLSRNAEFDHERDVEVPEKALKGRAIAVAAKLEAAPMDGRPVRVVKTDVIGERPLARFKFLYRTRTALQAEMIIPRSPSPIDLEETAVEDLTPEEMREIIRKQREQAMKVEDEPPRVKRERSLSSNVPLRPMKTTKTSEGKTLYHLDSDNEEEEEDGEEEEEEDDESTPIAHEPELIEIVDH